VNEGLNNITSAISSYNHQSIIKIGDKSMGLSEVEKKLVLSAKKKGMKNLSKEEIIAVKKYKKLLEMQKKAKEQKASAKKEKSTTTHKELTLTPMEKKLVLSARKKGMKGLTKEEIIAVKKYKLILAQEKSKKETPKKEVSHKQVDTKSKKLPVIDKDIPDIPKVKKEHFKKFKGKKILIAEDNVINRKMLEALLADSGIEIDVAENGAELLQKLAKSDKCDMILMDIQMPKMDGLEATRRIRKSKKFQNLPIVALTSATEKEEYRNIIKAGMNAYLSKPVVLGKLYNVFRLFIGDKK